ncbi:head GIN domain-containing protein [Bacteroides sp.]|uniref:head GIN domain-containing protein n=1 Tax=Bacteroides sp. TaxID=29523 RepID=UPI00261FF191|nr:head GIN domain-containing protein [Bacteroides sp.]MDD3037692.1 DUF2807 domain-containing protein [Bacteroides sp.]
MKKLKITFMWIAVMLLSVTGVKAQTVTPSKNYITREVKNVSNFNSIKVLGSPDVEYRQSIGSQTTVSIYGSDNLVDLLEVSTVDGVLQVNMKNNVNIQGGEWRLKVIASSPSLINVDIQGSGDVDLKGLIQGTDIKLNIVGSGDIDTENLKYANVSAVVKGSGDIVLNNLKVSNLNAEVFGSGDIEMKGMAQRAVLAVNGSGDIDAEKLVGVNVVATVSGSGDIVCNVSKQLDATVNGSGDIEYGGNPSVINKKGKRDQISKR